MFFNLWMGFGDYIAAGTLYIQIALQNSSSASLPLQQWFPRAGRLGINEVAATIGGGGGQIKPLVGGGCWWTWQSGIQQPGSVTNSPLVSPHWRFTASTDLGLRSVFICWRSVCAPSEAPGGTQGHVQRGDALSDLSLTPAHVTFPVKRGASKAKETRRILHITILASLQSSAASGDGDFYQEIAHWGFFLLQPRGSQPCCKLSAFNNEMKDWGLDHYKQGIL